MASDEAINRAIGGSPPRVPVGFGCFSFVPDVSEPAFTANEYLGVVAAALERSPGIEDVSAHVLDDVDVTLSVDPPKGDYDVWGEEPAPFPGGGSISFRAHIPNRLQRQLVEESGGSGLVRTETEDFRVHVHSGWAVPYAAVELLGAPSDASPSDGVQVMREFLQHELRRAGSERVRFTALGPSPLHADFYLEPRERPPGETATFWRLEYTRPAYHRYVYGFDPTELELMRPAELFAFEVGSEVDFLYRMVLTERERARHWVELRDAMSELVTLQRRSGVKGFVSKAWKSARLLDDALISLTDFEGREVAEVSALVREFKEDYVSGAEVYAKELVESQVNTRAEYPTAQTRELIRMFETRRLTDRDLFVVLMSSGVGGVVGAAATLLAS
jgi:hypothetical protein